MNAAAVILQFRQQIAATRGKLKPKWRKTCGFPARRHSVKGHLRQVRAERYGS